MQYTITYSCGHEGTADVYGPPDECQAKLADMEQNWICPDCAARERDERNERAAIANAEAGLPELTGTPRQIAWAETIRFEALADMADVADNIKQKYAPGSPQVRAANEALDFMRDISEASYWINNRRDDALTGRYTKIVKLLIRHERAMTPQAQAQAAPPRRPRERRPPQARHETTYVPA